MLERLLWRFLNRLMLRAARHQRVREGSVVLCDEQEKVAFVFNALKISSEDDSAVFYRFDSRDDFYTRKGRQLTH